MEGCRYFDPCEGLPRSTSLRVGSRASAPFGWRDFVRRHPEEGARGKPVDVHLTRQVWETMCEVNALVNGALASTSTCEPNGGGYAFDQEGGCGLSALVKRKLLIQRGFPRSALLLAAVRGLPSAEAVVCEPPDHALLTAKTDRGDFILDNLAEDILPWSETGYRFIKRQAQSDPNVWLCCGGP